LTVAAVIAIVISTVGCPASVDQARGRAGVGISTWFSPSATIGLASGACFAFSAVGYRGAALALGHPQPWVAGIYALVWAQSMQTIALGAYLLVRDRDGLRKVIGEWRISTLAGFMGAAASLGWFTAFAMRSAVDVRIVGWSR
jgi:hypothetical protein